MGSTQILYSTSILHGSYQDSVCNGDVLGHLVVSGGIWGQLTPEGVKVVSHSRTECKNLQNVVRCIASNASEALKHCKLQGQISELAKRLQSGEGTMHDLCIYTAYLKSVAEFRHPAAAPRQPTREPLRYLLCLSFDHL